MALTRSSTRRTASGRYIEVSTEGVAASSMDARDRDPSLATRLMRPVHRLVASAARNSCVCSVCSVSGEPIRVMVVDDHPMWRDAVARDLAAEGFEVVATAATGTEAITRAKAARPGVVVLDLNIPTPNGVEVTTSLMSFDEPPRVLVLSASGEQLDVLDAVKAGATGYMVKSASRQELVTAVRRVAAGDTVFTPGLAGLVLGEFRRLSEAPPTAGSATPRLTERV